LSDQDCNADRLPNTLILVRRCANRVTGKLASLAFPLHKIYWLQEALAQVMPILEVAILALA